MKAKEKIATIVDQFSVKSKLLSFEELSAGHIHKSYKITLVEGDQFVLQKINTRIFKDVNQLMNTKFSISEHLNNNIGVSKQVLTFLKTKNGETRFHDKDSKAYYCLSKYILNGITIDKTVNRKSAKEAGIFFGDFILQCARLDPNTFPPIIPHFHSVPHRFMEFQNALKTAPSNRYEGAKEYISLIHSYRDEMSHLDTLIKTGKIRIRLTHNDPKLSNILFDEAYNGICVIDTDTVMPGTLAFDFGDAVRTICSNAKEDEREQEKVTINLDYFRSFTKGFLQKTMEIADPAELNSLYLGVKTLTFIMAMRFLTDYLNHDIYYSTIYEGQNFDRARNQFSLLENVLLNKEKLQEIIQEEIAIYKTQKLP